MNPKKLKKLALLKKVVKSSGKHKMPNGKMMKDSDMKEKNWEKGEY